MAMHICPKCKRRYNMCAVKASIWLKDGYRAKAEVQFWHQCTGSKHRTTIPVRYAYDGDTMLKEGEEKLDKLVRLSV